ncbi:class I SAM-dependent rRNA methyltransferase [Cyclonatronum proteinivorum]|nr:class I SAM-dependent methyltransferase [Cyclonatronum proteinivorum]
MSSSLPVLLLKPGRVKSMLRRHPWIFSGAIKTVTGKPQPGETVRVEAADGTSLGLAAWSPKSQIRAKVWSFDPADSIDETFFWQRVAQAVDFRESASFAPRESGSVSRLIHAESDGLPGIVADRYGEVIVMQCLSAGAERWKAVVARALLQETGAVAIYERSDTEVRKLEGLPKTKGWLLTAKGAGTAKPDTRLVITEDGIQYRIDIEAGHKTGFYLDQRESRRLVGLESAGREILNCFSYTGGFSLAAAKNGAKHITSIDVSAEALQLAQENAALNGFSADRFEWVQEDVFQTLRRFTQEGRSFDGIILDPPKFAHTASQAQRAARGYKDINRLAFGLLRPGGWLATFSCSGGVNAELFQKIVASAALDAGAEAAITGLYHQSADHPVRLSVPETAYLKGLHCRI